MKKITTLMLSMLLCIVAVAQKFELKVKTEGLDGKKVYWSYYPKKDKVDSLIVKGGSFTIAKNLKTAEIITLIVEGARIPSYFFAENGKAIGSFKLDNNKFTGTIEGGKLQKEYNVYVELSKRYSANAQKTWEAASKAKKDKNDSLAAHLDKALDSLQADIKEAKKKLIEENADNLLSLLLINQSIYTYDYESLKEALAKSNKSTQTSTLYATLITKRDHLEKVKVGNVAPDFTLDTPDGQKLSLSQFRGKIVILDCWASWCGPCRAESPNVVKLYNEFKDKGLVILSASFDQDKAAWIKAISDDKLAWNHVSDLKGWQTIVADLYVVNAIPDTFVIDRDGKILARGLRGEKLRDKIAEIFNK